MSKGIEELFTAPKKAPAKKQPATEKAPVKEKAPQEKSEPKPVSIPVTECPEHIRYMGEGKYVTLQVNGQRQGANIVITDIQVVR